ncbi:MAG TPA: TetR-like C-terminal domain-containing protein [Spirochaetia bacterium]|nr:TetR-like C-terminal domain-containing protein [Spirochaetia bacterium]
MPRKVAVSIMAATVVSWWLEEGMKYSPERVSAWMRHVLIRGYLTVGAGKEG